MINDKNKDTTPTLQNTETIQALATTLQNTISNIHASPADMLTHQAHILDHIFTHILQKSKIDHKYHIDDDRMKIALTAQKQCRQTLDSLKKIKRTKDT